MQIVLYFVKLFDELIQNATLQQNCCRWSFHNRISLQLNSFCLALVPFTTENELQFSKHFFASDLVTWPEDTINMSALAAGCNVDSCRVSLLVCYHLSMPSTGCSLSGVNEQKQTGAAFSDVLLKSYTVEATGLVLLTQLCWHMYSLFTVRVMYIIFTVHFQYLQYIYIGIVMVCT